MIHMPCHQRFFESDGMLPPEITSSGRPIPIKLGVDSATIALRMFITTINIIDEKKKFGARWCPKIRKNCLPYSAAQSRIHCSGSAVLRSTTFAMLVQLVIPITAEIVITLDFPAAARRKMTRRRFASTKDLGQPHQKRVQPRRCTSADCARENGNHSGNQRRKQTDRQRYSAAMPDHRKYLFPSYRFKQKFRHGMTEQFSDPYTRIASS